MKFHMVIAICLNLKLWIHEKFVSQLQAHENWAYFYEMEAKNGNFSGFYASCKIDWSEFFSRAHQKKLWYLSTTYENFIKIWKTFTKKNFMTLSSNWKVKIFTTLLIKSWSYQFLSLIDLKSIKKFIIASAKKNLALKAKKAAKWPRSFYMVLTVCTTFNPVLTRISLEGFRHWKVSHVEVLLHRVRNTGRNCSRHSPGYRSLRQTWLWNGYTVSATELVPYDGQSGLQKVIVLG